jgi:hypothetical protein
MFSRNWGCVGGSAVLTGHGCSTALYSGQTLVSVWPAPAPTPNVPMNLPSDRSLTDWVVPSDTSALCDAIPVLWQNTDIQILSLLGEQITQSASTATISNTQSTSPLTATGSLGVISYNSSLTPSASSSLSIGAKAAIGIIIPSAFLALIVGILLFFRRRNSRNQQAHHELSTSPSIDSSNWTQLSSL